VRDFLAFLDEHVGDVVTVEVGVVADDLPNTSRPAATFYGVMGSIKMQDDEDRPGRDVGFVSVGSQEGQREGFHMKSDRATKVVVNHIGAKVWFVDDHYISVIP
jgi:hypothetical protein